MVRQIFPERRDGEKIYDIDRVKQVIPYIFAVLICVCASLPVFSQNILQDEAFSIVLVRNSVSEMLRGTAADVHPPLYYLLMMAVKFFMGGKESLTAYRFLSLVGTWLNLLLVGATLVRKRWGVCSANVYILFFGLTYYTLEFSVMVRMYSWGTFFVTLSAVLALFYYEGERTKDIVLCGIVTLLAMYTHYYALLAVFILWLFLLAGGIKKKALLKRILIAGTCIVIGYLPWLSAFYHQTRTVAEYYWISYLPVDHIINAPSHMAETTALPGTGRIFQILLVVIFLLAVIRKKYEAVICGLITVGVLAAAVIFSLLIHPIWIVRYFYIMWGLMALMAAIVAGEKYSFASWIPQTILCFFLLLYGCFSIKTIQGVMQTNAGWWKAYLEENVAQDAFIMVDDYGERNLLYRYLFPEANLLMLQSVTEEQIVMFAREAKDGELWYLPNETFITFGEERIEQVMEQYGYRILDENAETCHMQYGNMRIRRIEEVDANE